MAEIKHKQPEPTKNLLELTQHRRSRRSNGGSVGAQDVEQIETCERMLFESETESLLKPKTSLVHSRSSSDLIINSNPNPMTRLASLRSEAPLSSRKKSLNQRDKDHHDLYLTSVSNQGPRLSTCSIKGQGQGGPAKLRIRREKSAAILVAIVVLFVACHSYRLALRIYEVAFPKAHTMDNFKLCFDINK